MDPNTGEQMTAPASSSASAAAQPAATTSYASDRPRREAPLRDPNDFPSTSKQQQQSQQQQQQQQRTPTQDLRPQLMHLTSFVQPLSGSFLPTSSPSPASTSGKAIGGPVSSSSLNMGSASGSVVEAGGGGSGRATGGHEVQRQQQLENLRRRIAGQPKLEPSRSVTMRWDDESLRDDVFRIIDQFLAEEGMGATRQTLAEEWQGKAREREEASGDAKKLRKAVLEGAWEEVDKLLAKPIVRNLNTLKYACYKQQYLELIETREYQKAFTQLNKKLRALEHFQPSLDEFRDLCYLLSAKSVSDAPSFRSWEGIQSGREAVVKQFSSLLERDQEERRDREGIEREFVPPSRLRELLAQAAAYQVEFARYHPKKAPLITSLLHDFEASALPNSLHSQMRGHRKHVKALAFVGKEGRRIVTGSLDGTLGLYDTNSGEREGVLEHKGRVWDVDASADGLVVAGAGGEGIVSLWSVADRKRRITLAGGQGDAYAVAFDPTDTSGGRIMGAGYDKLVRLWDARTGALLQTFTGHSLGVTSVNFSPDGRLATTASKDCTVRLWDLTSGLCVSVLRSHLGEVTSSEIKPSGRSSSRLLLSASKDNSSVLTDLRTLKPLQRYKGAQNTRANFIRSSFLHNDLLATGDESGSVIIHELDSPEAVQRLRGGHSGVCYGARWNAAQSLLVSCGDDGASSWIWRDPTAATTMDVDVGA